MRPLARALLVSIALAAVLVVNWLANALPLNGITTGEISDAFPVLFKPAGYAFSIWGLIYLGLMAFAVYHVLPEAREDRVLPAITGPYLLSCLANAGWLIAWHYEQFVATLLVMLVLLGSLITVYRRLDPGRRTASGAARWLVYIPMSLYLSWICVATIANASILFYDLGWRNGLSEVLAVTLVLVAGGLSVAVAGPRRDGAFAGVMIWALLAVGVAQADHTALAIAAYATTVAIAAGMVILRSKPRAANLPKP